MDRYLTADQIAQQLSVEVEMVQHWVQQGKLPAFPLEQAGYRIRQEDFDHFVQEQIEQAARALLVEHLPDVIFRLDLHLRHLYISPTIERITGYPPEAWSGKTGREMGLPPEACDQFEALCQQAIATREPQQMEFFYGGHWQRSRIHPEYAPTGSVHALIGITEDITERKQRELNTTFLSELEQDFHHLSSPNELLETVGSKITRHFHLSRLILTRVNEATNEVTDLYDTQKQTGVSTPNFQRLADYIDERYLDEFRAGNIIAVNGTATDPRTAHTTHANSAATDHRAQPVHAQLIAPHLSDQHLNLIIILQRNEPYQWRSDEIELARALVARIDLYLERAHTEQALREAEQQVQAERQRLHDLFMQAPVLLTVLRGPDLVFELANPLYMQIVGLHRDIIGKPFLEALPEMEGQGFFELLETVYRTGKPFSSNVVQVHVVRQENEPPEEAYYTFVYQPSYNTSVEIDGVIVFGFEITAQIAARKRAEESEERLRSMADSMPQLVWSARADGAIDFFNQRLSEYTTVNRNKDNIYEWQTIVHPDDRASTIRDWEQALRTGTLFEHEQRLQMKDGTYRWHLVRGVPIYDAHGSILRWYGTKTDIEQLKQLEQQKNDFLGVVSHELRTPVTSAKAFAEVLENRFRKAGDEKNALLLGKINAQMEKLTLLISDLLDVTRLEAGKLHFHEDFFAFDDLVERIIEEVQRTTTHTIQREGSTGVTVYGDRERIGQVITNLLTNAIKYSPNATRVVVTSASNRQEVTLCVQDFGIGIAREKLPHVFERFFRETGTREETFPGLGLGLYVAAEILKRQGGEIWAESEKGHGSTFCFTLPLQGSKHTRRHNDLYVEEEEGHE